MLVSIKIFYKIKIIEEDFKKSGSQLVLVNYFD